MSQRLSAVIALVCLIAAGLLLVISSVRTFPGGLIALLLLVGALAVASVVALPVNFLGSRHYAFRG